MSGDCGFDTKEDLDIRASSLEQCMKCFRNKSNTHCPAYFALLRFSLGKDGVVIKGVCRACVEGYHKQCECIDSDAGECCCGERL